MGALLTRLFWLLCLTYAALIVHASLTLPDRVPTHWNGGGSPDGWGTRTETISMYVVVGALMASVFGAMLVLIPRHLDHPSTNLPNKEYWTDPVRLEQSRERTRVDLGVIACLSMVFMCLVPPAIAAAVADPPAYDLPGWVTVAFIAWLVAMLGYAAWMVMGRWRIPPEDQVGDLGPHTIH